MLCKVQSPIGSVVMSVLVVCRTGAGLPLLAAGGTAGVLTIWNLEENKLHTVLKDAHNGPVCALAFFTGTFLVSYGMHDYIDE